MKLQLTANVLRMAGDVFDSDTIEKIHVLSNTGTCLKPDP